MLFNAAAILGLLGLLLFVYGLLWYLKISRELQELKKEDLVAYYLDLFYRLLPRPFWSVVAGMLLLLLALITGTVAFCLDFGN